MYSSVNVLRSMQSFEKSEQFNGFSKVVIIASDEIEYSSGTDTGRTLTLNCPWGTQEIANNILKSIKGFQYQPMSASGVLVDPSAEIGDGINANGVYSGIYTLEINYNSNLPHNVSAPPDEEVDHEYPYKSKRDRTIRRNYINLKSELSIQNDRITAEVENRQNDVKELRASISIQADRITQEVSDRQDDVTSINSLLDIHAGQIEARVSKNGGNPSSFGWVLDDSSWTIRASGRDILKATQNGLEVYGKITATSGTIGGFTIESDYLSYNNQTWGGTNAVGVYIGPNGLQLGSNFRVDSAGNLTAYSGTFSGSVRAGSILYGNDNGYFDGEGISAESIYGGYGGKISSDTLSTYNLTGGVNTSLGYADFANGVFNGWNKAAYAYIDSLHATNSFYIGNYAIRRKQASFTDGDGNKIYLNYLQWNPT